MFWDRWFELSNLWKRYPLIIKTTNTKTGHEVHERYYVIILPNVISTRIAKLLCSRESYL